MKNGSRQNNGIKTSSIIYRPLFTIICRPNKTQQTVYLHNRMLFFTLNIFHIYTRENKILKSNCEFILLLKCGEKKIYIR